MTLAQLLGIAPGLTAVIGGGGKTTALLTLGRELACKGTVILCTTTKIYPFSGLPLSTGGTEALREALAQAPLVCAGVPGAEGKLSAPPAPMEALKALADYVLVEADGSRGLPVKAHLDHEPVIPQAADRILCLVGASAFGRPVREVVHRFEQFCALTGLPPEAPVTPAAVAKLLKSEDLGGDIFVNQSDVPGGLAGAAALAEELRRPLWAGALQKGEWRCLF